MARRVRRAALSVDVLQTIPIVPSSLMSTPRSTLHFLYRVGDLTELEIEVGRAVAKNDELASAENHLVQSEILKVTAIGDHQKSLCLRPFDRVFR